jgi:pilus assembly protein CpaB
MKVHAMRPKTLILLVLALGCGLVESIGISQVMQRNQDTGPSSETSPVWVAKADIKDNEPLTMQNLKLEQWPKEKIPPGSLSKMEEIEGKRSRVKIYQGEAILDKKLLGKDEVDVSFNVPIGMRLYTVLGDPMASQGGLLHPGARVDVLVFVSKNTGPLETGTKTILQDIRVFAVNDQVKAADEKGGNESITAKTVTLLLTPSQAEKIALASEVGKIRLVMRSPDDSAVVDPAGTRLQDIFTMEKSDRAVETMDHAPANPKLPGSGLTALLNQAQQAVSPTPSVISSAPANEDISYTIQVIRGTEITEVPFTRKFDDPNHWENGSPSHDSSDTAGASPAPEPAKTKSSANASGSKPAGDSSSGSPKLVPNTTSSSSHS